MLGADAPITTIVRDSLGPGVTDTAEGAVDGVNDGTPATPLAGGSGEGADSGGRTVKLSEDTRGGGT
ncbi:MAG: hypothetical protein VKP62_06245 [Candidatus Sericytochromatia bacterium]|nr:hypothetical protein [Candidatus Sericytochromatia bacterium]